MPHYIPSQAAIGDSGGRIQYLKHMPMREQALHAAVGTGDTTAVSKVLQHGHNINCTNTQGETPLHQAIEQQNIPILHMLLKHGADPSRLPHYGVGTLYQAVETGNIAIVRMLFQNHDFKSELNLTNQLNPLMLAVVRENVEMTLLLLKQGARIDIKNERGESPLILAAMGTDPDRQFQLGILLLCYGADPNQKDPHGHEPIHYSWHNAFTAYVKEYGNTQPPSMLSLMSLARQSVLEQLVLHIKEPLSMEELVRQLPVPASLRDFLLFANN